MAERAGHHARSAGRVLLIGLDSADADLVDAWCADGTLPTLAALRRDGVWGRLRTTAEVMHVSAWPTMYTGASPGRHGLYHAYQITAGEAAVHRTRAEECALPPFWQLLDRAGRRCIVMDAFMDYRLPDFGGIQILEYGTWTWFTEPGATPRRMRREIVRRFGPYPAPEHTDVLNVPEPLGFRDRLVAGARVKGKAIRWLLAEHPWDLAFVTFGEPHGAGHYLWHLSDPDYPAFPSVRPPGTGHALRDVYAAVDAAIGGILEVVGDATTVLVVSGDGMGPNYSGCHLLPEVLHRLDLFHGAGVGRPADGEARPGAPRGLAARLRNAIPLGWRHAVTRCLPRRLHYQMSMRWVNAAIDWERSRAFCLPNANEGYVRVNLAGREPRGRVAPDAEYHAVLAEMEASFRALTVPPGARAADAVIRVDDVFSGPARRHLPDLVVTWNPAARTLTEVHAERCGLVQGPAGYQIAPYYTGNHRPHAFVAGRGPGIRPGATLGEAHIIDLPPTIFALLDVERPAQFEGRVWHELGRP